MPGVSANTRSPVVSEALFVDLHRAAGLDAVWPIGNAGLLHVYGYLLSTVDTAYGRKGDRWLGGGVARAFGLPGDTFAPWFVVPASESARWARNATPVVRDSTALERITTFALPYVDDPVGGESTLMWVDERGPAREVAPEEEMTLARTVIVQARSGATALLYAVGTEGSLSLATLFPLDWSVSDRDGAAWLAALEAGVQRLRYSAVDRRNVASAPLVDRRVSRRRN